MITWITPAPSADDDFRFWITVSYRDKPASLFLLGLMDSKGTVTSVSEMLSWRSAADDELFSAKPTLERRRVSGGYERRLDVGSAAAGLELVPDLVCRSRKGTLDWGWSLSLQKMKGGGGGKQLKSQNRQHCSFNKQNQHCGAFHFIWQHWGHYFCIFQEVLLTISPAGFLEVETVVTRFSPTSPILPWL